MLFDFGIWVASIVQKLKFWSSHPGILNFGIFVDVVNQTTVATLGNFPIQAQFVVLVFGLGDDVATATNLKSVGIFVGNIQVEHSIGHLPALANGLFVVIAPAFGGFSIK